MLNGTLADTWETNFATFVQKMDDLQLLITELDAIHEFSQLRAIVVTPAEAYVAEAFGIQCDAVLQIEDITIPGAKLLEVQTAIRNGSVQLIIGSDVAQFQTGGEFAYQIQSDYGGTLIWWKTVFYTEADYFSMMTFNLGALVSGIEGRSGGIIDQTVNIGLLALTVVLGFIALLEAVLLIQRARAE
jgi:ABC-type Zn uptake system ZnuABC Zn-binding protein ZnuA